MSLMNWKKYIVFKTKQQVHLQRKMKERRLHPLKVKKSDLKECSKYYEKIKNNIINEIEKFNYVTNEEEQKVLLRDYKILSYNGDFMGKVLTYKGKIYRGIYQESSLTFMELWETGILQILGKYELIPKTSISKYHTEDYPIILEHEIVTMSTSKIWNFEMIKDACILICLIQDICNYFGFKLHDGHLNNITFNNGHPVFTDIGSFVKNDDNIIGQKEDLLFAGCYRLLFWQLDNSILKRIQPYDEMNNSIWIHPMYYDDQTIEYKMMLKKYVRYHFFRSSIVANYLIYKMFCLYDIRPEYISLLFQNKDESSDISYYEEDMSAILKAIRFSKIDIENITDIGGSAGFFPRCLEEKLKVKVNSVEYKDKNSDLAYISFKNEKRNINTYLFNYIYGADNETLNVLKADLVTALDVTHNVAAYQVCKLDSLLNDLYKLTKKYIAITIHIMKQDIIQYTEVELENKISEFFKILYANRFVSTECDKGIVYLCEVKSNKESKVL